MDKLVPKNTSEGKSLIDKFLAAQDIRDNSKNTYNRALKQFLLWIQAEGIANPKREDVLQYKAYLDAQGVSPLTASGYLVSVRKFFEWTESEKLYPNIAKGIKGAKRAKGFRKDCLDIDQIKNLLNSIDRLTLQGKRDFAILNLMVRTGLRDIEIVRADIGDIRQQENEAILYVHGKGRDTKDEFVLLTHETLNPINEYLEARGQVNDNDPLFASYSNRNNGGRLTTRSVSRIVKQHLRGIGLDSGRLTAHSLRHTSITLSLKAGATIQEAQAMARHSSITTTMIYAHNLNRIEDAAERKIDTLLAGLN